MCACVCMCGSWAERGQDLAESSAQATALTKIAQARISVGNINLSMMSVIKLRRVRHAA